jgi:hypothetical protein
LKDSPRCYYVCNYITFLPVLGGLKNLYQLKKPLYWIQRRHRYNIGQKPCIENWYWLNMCVICLLRAYYMCK